MTLPTRITAGMLECMYTLVMRVTIGLRRIALERLLVIRSDSWRTQLRAPDPLKPSARPKRNRSDIGRLAPGTMPWDFGKW